MHELTPFQPFIIKRIGPSFDGRNILVDGITHPDVDELDLSPRIAHGGVYPSGYTALFADCSNFAAQCSAHGYYDITYRRVQLRPNPR
jgi:hypothetical protein